MGHVIGSDTTYTGNPVSFNAPHGGTMKSVSVPLTYSQDLHGYANPWPGGGGVNKFDLAAYFTEGETVSNNGITAEYSNGYLKVTGTNTSGSTFNIVYKSISGTLGAGTYISPHDRCSIRASVDGGSNANYGNAFTASTSVSLASFYVFIAASDTNLNWNIPMMIVSGSTRPTEYYPYSNICPITGLTGLSMYRTGANLFQPNPTCVYGKVRDDNGNEVTSSTSFYTTSFVPVKPSTQYTLKIVGQKAINSLRIYYLTANGGWISRTSTAYSTPTSFTTPAGCGSIEIQLSITGEQNLDNFDVYLSEGSTATTEPFGNTYSVDWSTPAGTAYHGTVDVVTGELTVNKMMFSANTSTMNNSEGFPGWKSSGVKANNPVNAMQPNALSNVGKGCGINTNGNNDIIFLPTQYYNGMTQSEWIALAQDVQILYELATPLTYQLTPKQITALIGQNYIWSSNNETLNTVLTAPVTGFAGWLIKCVTNGTPIEIPLKYMRAETYTVTPDQRMEWSAERDVTGVLHRETVQNLPPKIEFNTPLMTNSDINALNSIIKAAFTNYLQRNITIQFYDPERNQYWEWDCYMPDVKYHIRNSDTANNIINYEELRYAFIGY